MEKLPGGCAFGKVKEVKVFQIELSSSNVFPEPSAALAGSCGDGICQDVACLSLDCPKPETIENCPQDCK